MESGSTVTASSTHMENHLKRPKANESNDDRISNLPESLISRILSFLPTKDAVGTSVLSKNWTKCWTSITKLDLDDRVICSPKKATGEQHFINFVNRTLLLTKGSSWESVSLVFANKYDVSLVNTWISSILNRGVKNLNLCIDTSFELPFSPLTSHSIFNSFSIEELVLQMWSSCIRVPTSFVCFGKLKLLKLLGITFTLDSINNLELSLPVLKKFEMINCTWLSANAVTFVAPLLESVLLHIVEVDPPELPNYAIKFSASHLTEFSCMIFCYVSPLPQQIVMLEPSSAHNASVSIVLEVYETGFSAFQLLKQFNQVKYLEFQGAEVMAQSNVADLPLFGMLSHLELLFVAGEVLLGLLLKSPILKTLVLQGISNFDEELLNSATVPHCLKSTLQVVKFVRVQGSVHELCSAKFIMENGTVLKRISFSIDHWVEKSKAIEEFKEKIFSFKKSFPFTIEGFSDD